MTIEVLNECGADVDEQALVTVARHVLTRMGVSPLAELSISLQDATEMARLHVQHMDEPGPTDVLAFPMDELDLRGSRGVPQGSMPEESDDGPPALLGDVVLCPEVAERQAREAGHSTLDELRLLTTHGVLHLLGFDHGTPEEHAEMFGLQAELLAAEPSGALPGGDGQPADGAQAQQVGSDPGAGGDGESRRHP
ncbi:MAG TPA: rRNA maturation RNase YbeY [Mycobacteriales bacterium]|nr:rRNA maturation RNase YbeY [Mycobacteriales bacterium]